MELFKVECVYYKREDTSLSNLSFLLKNIKKEEQNNKKSDQWHWKIENDEEFEWS